MTTQSLIIFAVVGLVAGWFASLIIGGGRGLIEYLIIGCLGAVVGGFMFNLFGLYIGGWIAGSMIVALAGSVVLLLAVRLLKKRGAV